VQIIVSQGQLRWFAVRRLLTCGFFIASLLGVSSLILKTDGRMVFFAIVSGLGALIIGAYALKMLRLALAAKDTTVEFSPQSMTRTVAGVSVTDRIGEVMVYPDELAAFVPGTGLVDLPIGRARSSAALASLQSEGIPFVRMGGLAGTLLPVLGMFSVLVVGYLALRVAAYGAVFGILATAAWSPTVTTVLVISLVAAVIGVFVWRRVTARVDGGS
jgi:hypothetical protein